MSKHKNKNLNDEYFTNDELEKNNKNKEKRNNSRLSKIKFKDKSKNDYWMEEDF